MLAEKSALLGGSKVRRRVFPGHPVLGREETREVSSVLKSGLLSGFVAKAGPSFLGGGKVKKLEELFCRYFGVGHAVAMNSATSALHAALYAAGVEPGDEVLVSPYTMSASASAILMCGGIPVFVDVDSDIFCIDPGKMEERITKRTKAVVVVHLFGHPAPMREILALARKRRLKVIEDCAQAPGAKYHGRFVGTMGDVGVFSLNQHKTITTGEGGVAVTHDKKLALRMQLIRNHGEVVSDGIPEAKNIRCLGWNYRMTELEASVGIAQFRKLDKLTRHRVRLAEYLTRELSVFPGLTLPKPQKDCSHVYFVYPIGFDEKRVGISRGLFARALAAEGIPFGEGYVRPIYLEAIYRGRRMFSRSGFPFNLQRGANRKNYRRGSCPNAEYFHEKGLLITGLCRYPLLKKDIADIVRALRKIYSSIPLLRRRFESHHLS